MLTVRGRWELRPARGTAANHQGLEIVFIFLSHSSWKHKPNGINSAFGLMLMLQYFGHLMQRAGSLEKTLMLGKIEGTRREDRG